MIDQIWAILTTQESIIQIIKWFFIVGAFFGVIIGLAINFIPHSFVAWNNKLNHWYSSRKSLKPFEIMRETDSHVYKYNKIWGWAMLACSGIFIYSFFTWEFSEQLLQELFTGVENAIIAGIVFEVIKIFLAVFILSGIPVWVLLIFQPELLKRISKVFNHWYSSRLFLLPMVKMHYQFDEMVLKNNRVFGIIFVSGSLYILYSMIYYFRVF